MPMYVYEAKSGGCAKCASPGFEVMQSLNDAKLTQCPDCGAEHRIHLLLRERGVFRLCRPDLRQCRLQVRDGILRRNICFCVHDLCSFFFAVPSARKPSSG